MNYNALGFKIGEIGGGGGGVAQRPTTTCTKFRLITTMGVMVNGPFLTKIFAELKTEKTTICELRPLIQNSA